MVQWQKLTLIGFHFSHCGWSPVLRPGLGALLHLDGSSVRGGAARAEPPAVATRVSIHGHGLSSGAAVLNQAVGLQSHVLRPGFSHKHLLSLIPLKSFLGGKKILLEILKFEAISTTDLYEVLYTTVTPHSVKHICIRRMSSTFLSLSLF